MKLAALAVAAAIVGTAPAAVGQDHGFDAERLERIQVMMDGAVAEGRIPSGIAMVARDGEIVWLRTSGDMGPGVPMRGDAIIPLASVGKMFTATAAMILYERGVIDLDDPVSDFIPEFDDVKVEVTNDAGEIELVDPNGPVTIFHLLTHTGGLNINGDAFNDVWNRNAAITTTTQLARETAAIPLFAQPGDAFLYGWGGSSYEVLGAVIEIASGQTLEAFMQDNIFDPLGMTASSFYNPDDKADRMPAFYRRDDDGALVQVRPYGQDFPRTTFFHGGGGVRTSPQDILTFTEIFLNGGRSGNVQLLSPKTVQLMMTDHLGDRSPWPGGEYGWGFGASVRNFVDQFGAGSPGQYGWVGGGYAILWVDPQERMVGFFAFPIQPPGDNDLLSAFERAVYAAMTDSYLD